MTLLFLLFKPILLMLVRRVFKKQMKEFAVQMMEEYAKTTDNDVDDQLVGTSEKAMRLAQSKDIKVTKYSLAQKNLTEERTWHFGAIKTM